MSKIVRSAVVVLSVLVAFGVPSVRGRAAGEPAETYYYNAGRRVPIVRSSTRMALVVSDASERAAALERARLLGSVRSVRDVKAGGIVEVTVADASKAPSLELADVARQSGGVLLPVFYEPGLERDASTLFVNEEVLVRFRPEVTSEVVDATIARLGADAIESLRYAPNGFRLHVSSSDATRNALTVANALYETGLCVWAHPNFLAHHTLRFVPNDPIYPSQWHLNNTGQFNGTPGADVNAPEAWDVTQGSTSISVAVADTGIDWHHEDLEVMVDGVPKIHDPRDVVHGDNDPFPQAGDADGAHGTAASGVAVAAFNNGLDSAGIAPKCRFVPIQLYAESTFTPNSTEADAFTWAADHADVMSNSWGPDNAGTLLPDATRNAMDYCATNGRGGKGTVIFFAAGNSNFDINQNNNDTYSSYSGVIAVAASNNLGNKSGYSSFGPSVSVNAPSNGGTANGGIRTLDATGNLGYGSGNTTSTFGGTSSACPLAAGVGALVLSVNPNLTWREVKSVLEQSADKIDVGSQFGMYDARGHSDYYGFGRVNAQRAVALALVGGPDTPGLSTGGTYFLRNSSSSGPADATFGFGAGTPGVKPLAGDWDGNGTTTIGLYNSATGSFFLRNSNTPGAADITINFGPAGVGAVPVVGDWDNNGTVTVGIFVPSSATFFLRNSNTPGNADIAFQFGAAPSTQAPVVGDWNNDGVDTVGLYSPATGTFFLRNTNAPGSADVVFSFGAGGIGLVPVAGDWNADGADSIGVYDPSTGAFFLKNANAGGVADATFVYGAGNADPLIGNWDGY